MLRLGILISGSGSNFQAVIDAVESERLKAKIVKVIADRPAAGLDRAEKHNIPHLLINRREHRNDLSDLINEELEDRVDMIVLAGFLSILSNDFISAWDRKIINIHPSLLPDFGGRGMYGIHVHEAVLAAGRTESGCTVHFVDQGIDTGEIILQRRVPVLKNDTPETLQQRVLKEEHPLLVEALCQISLNYGKD